MTTQTGRPIHRNTLARWLKAVEDQIPDDYKHNNKRQYFTPIQTQWILNHFVVTPL